MERSNDLTPVFPEIDVMQAERLGYAFSQRHDVAAAACYVNTTAPSPCIKEDNYTTQSQHVQTLHSHASNNNYFFCAPYPISP
jgi:hypothetical protein